MRQQKRFKIGAITLILMFSTTLGSFACEVCNKNQPKIFRGITHGGGPQSGWDYFVVISMVLITIYTLYATIRCFANDKEEAKYNDIKNTIITKH